MFANQAEETKVARCDASVSFIPFGPLAIEIAYAIIYVNLIIYLI